MSDATPVPATEPAVEPVLDLTPATGMPALFLDLAEKRMEMRAKGTKHGITLAMLGDFYHRRGPATKEELAELAKDAALELLYRRYWLAWGFDRLPAEIAPMVWDFAIERGSDEMMQLTQKSIRDLLPSAMKPTGLLDADTAGALAHLVKEGKAVALAEQIHRRRTSVVSVVISALRGERKRLNLGGALMIVGKVALAAKTGVKLP
jgi:hypothetical protein